MMRWQLWSSVAAGVLSVGGGSTYWIVNRPGAKDTALADSAPLGSSPHAVPPKPISLMASDEPAGSGPAAFVSPASFHAPASEEPVVRGNHEEASGLSAPPLPQATFEPTSQPVEPPATSLMPPPSMPASNPVRRSPYRANMNDAPQANDAALSAPAGLSAPPALATDPSALVADAAPDPAPEVITAPAVLEQPSAELQSLPIANDASALAEPANEPITPITVAEPSAARPMPRLGTGSRPFSTEAGTARLTSNVPGERKLEGVQAPSLVVERFAPEEIQVGKPAKFTIKVRNVGATAAHDVIVTDRVPQGTSFLAATPDTNPAADGALLWNLGVVQPGDEATLTVELMPEAEGEIGSIAQVTFNAQAAVRTIATKPLLTIEHAGPAKVLIGEEVPFHISVSNPGSGPTTGVVIEVDVPDGLVHEGGREIMSDRFDLRPNETHKLELVLKAVQPGKIQSVVRAVGEGNLVAKHSSPLEIIAPALQVGVNGPSRRFLDRQVTYQVTIANPGTAPAQNLELIARLPQGLKFINTEKKGHYDAQQHVVRWNLEELPPGEQGTVTLTAMPIETGEQRLLVEARGALAIEHRHEHTTVVEDITDLIFSVTDENVPIEVGSDTVYQIRIANNGTKSAKNIRIAAQIPAGLEVLDADGPAQFSQQGDQLVSQPLADLAKQEEAVFRITVKGNRAGDHILRVQLTCDEFSAPVTKEEITKVYADQ